MSELSARTEKLVNLAVKAHEKRAEGEVQYVVRTSMKTYGLTKEAIVLLMANPENTEKGKSLRAQIEAQQDRMLAKMLVGE